MKIRGALRIGATDRHAGAVRFFPERTPAPKSSTHLSLAGRRTPELDRDPAVGPLADDVTVARAELEKQCPELLIDDRTWDERLWARFRGLDDAAYGLTSGPYRT